MNAVVDTDVVSYTFRRDTRAAFYKSRLIGYSAILSFMTVAELDSWVLHWRMRPGGNCPA